MRLFAILAVLVATSALGAQTYSVSSQSITYADLGGGTNVTLADDAIGSPISPTGFSFPYFGGTYTSFQIASNGYIVLGGSGTVTSAMPDHATSPGLVIAPLWTDLRPGTSLSAERISWRFGGGTLTVEWFNTLQRKATGPTAPTGNPAVRMQVVLSGSTGEITFQYGAPGGFQQFGALSNFAGAVAISGPSGTSQAVVAGEISGFVSSTGAVTAYPANMQVLFQPLSSPTFTSTPVTTATVGQQYNYALTTIASPAPTYTANVKPSWLTQNGRFLSGFPQASDVGQHSVSITATNSQGSAIHNFTITVNPVAAAPVITSTAPTGAVVGTPYTYTVTASGFPAATFSASGLPAWLSLTGDTLSGTPQPSDAGVSGTVTITATNVHGADDEMFTITVEDFAAISSFPGLNATVGAAYSYVVTATGFPAPTFSATNLPAWLTLIGDTLSGTPQAADVGTAGPISISATNALGTDVQVFSTQVSPAPVPPTITSVAATTAMATVFYSYTIVATGTPAPTISGAGLPAWLTLSGNVLSGTPQVTDLGPSPQITITATSSAGMDQQQFVITVANAPVGPVITSSAPATATVGEVYSYGLSASGNPPPAFSVTGQPAWLNLSGSTLAGVPTGLDVGLTATITVTATNSAGTDQQQFTIVVAPAPVGGGGDGGGSGGCAASSVGALPWLALLPVLAVWSRRRRV